MSGSSCAGVVITDITVPTVTFSDISVNSISSSLVVLPRTLSLIFCALLNPTPGTFPISCPAKNAASKPGKRRVCASGLLTLPASLAVSLVVEIPAEQVWLKFVRIWVLMKEARCEARKRRWWSSEWGPDDAAGGYV